MSSGTYKEREAHKSLVKHYYQGLLNFSLKGDDISEMTWNKQQNFLEATILNPLIQKYPINKEFSRLFIKKLIAYLEPSQEVHDEMYRQLCDLMNNNAEQDQYHYKHYIVGNNMVNTIIMKETNNMVVNGTTGMRTWQAALMIADWALCHKEMFVNKKILELGSGVGFTGITIAKLCKTKELIFTDCHDDVLKMICHNININFSDVQKEEMIDVITFQNKNFNLGVMTLDWNHMDSFSNNVVPDVIIGADVVYDPILTDPLCNVLKTFMRRNENVEVYIASVIRNRDTFESFLEKIESMGFQYEVLQQPRCIFLQWETDTEMCLISIKRNKSS